MLISGNRLSKLIIKSFIGPFLLSFVLVILFFVMLFIWKYIDDIMGKGIEWYYITELIILQAAEIVPIAFPLSILISSTMTMGSLAENYELAALKSSGMSLIKIMRPMYLIVFGLFLCSLWFTNYVSPTAAIKFKQILWDIVHKKPMLELKEGAFYTDLKGFSIRVAGKNEDTGELKDVLIYDLRKPSAGSKTVIRAKRGQTKKSSSGNYMFLELYDGVSYDEQQSNNTKGKNHPLVRSTFEKSVLTLDLSSFDFQETEEDRFNNLMSRLNMRQLMEVRDSLSLMIEDKKGKLRSLVNKSIYLNEDSTTVALTDIGTADPFYEELSLADKSRALAIAKSSAENVRAHVKRQKNELKYHFKSRNNALIVWNEKLGFAIAIIVFFLIGAPLGAIIKKGGLGLPMLFSILLYLLYHIINMIGRKMAKSYILEPYQGLLLASAILFPIGVFLTYKAANDSKLFEKEQYLKPFKKLFGKRNSIHEDITTVQ